MSEEQVSEFDRMEAGRHRLRYQASLLAFVREAWKIVEPDREFVENWHIRELCRVLEEVHAGKTKRLVINVPPGTMKSLLVNVIWPAWIWTKNPKYRVLTAAYGAHLSTRDNVRVRDIVTSPWYQGLFELTLVEDQNTKTRYNTTAGGWRIATSVGGVGTGEHPDLILIDDALTATQAESEQERTGVNQWFDRTISTRGVSRDVAIVVVGQRLQVEDLPGYLLAKGGWRHVRWPMRFEKCICPPGAVGDQRCNLHRADPGWSPDPLDPRTEPGELLWPALFTEEKVKQLELDLGEYGAAGQLQQRPAPEGGGQFKREWFKILTAMPANVCRSARGWDTAATDGAGDWTTGIRIDEFDEGKFLVSDAQRAQLGPAGVDALMRQIAILDGAGCAQREEKEGGSSGKAVIEARAKALVGYDYAGVQISGSKSTRVKPFRAQCEAGNVYLLLGSWNEEYLRELCNFPTGKHDDQVDGSSTAFNAVLLEPRIDSFVVW